MFVFHDSVSNELIDRRFQNETENEPSCKKRETKGNTSYDPVTI